MDSLSLLHTALQCEAAAAELARQATRFTVAETAQRVFTAHMISLQSRSFNKLLECAGSTYSAQLPVLESACQCAANSLMEYAENLKSLSKEYEFITAALQQLSNQYSAVRARVIDFIAEHTGVFPEEGKPLIERLGVYACIADPQQNYYAQMQWEQLAREHNQVQAKLLATTTEKLQLERRYEESVTKLISRLNAIELPNPALPIEVAADISGVKLAFVQKQDHSSASSFEKLLVADDTNALQAFWNQLSSSERQRLIDRNSWYLADASGIPFTIRQVAAQHAFASAQQDPRRALIALGVEPTLANQEQLQYELRQISAALNIAGEQAYLLGLGWHDEQLTAQILLGDLQSAQNIAVLVPGMGSNVAGIKNLVGAGKNLRETVAAKTGKSNTAILVWQGYDSPNMLQEPGIQKANSAATALARDLTVIKQQQPHARVSLIGHSYGSTTAAQALQITDHRVANFITVGSAGLQSNLRRQKLQTERVYATTAAPEQQSWSAARSVGNPSARKFFKHRLHLASDLIAPIGIAIGEHKMDPRDIEGVVVLPANSLYAQHLPVGSHSLYNEDPQAALDAGYGYFNRGTQAIEAVAEVVASE